MKQVAIGICLRAEHPHSAKQNRKYSTSICVYPSGFDNLLANLIKDDGLDLVVRNEDLGFTFFPTRGVRMVTQSL